LSSREVNCLVQALKEYPVVESHPKKRLESNGRRSSLLVECAEGENR